jgi:replicative DNA helicase
VTPETFLFNPVSSQNLQILDDNVGIYDTFLSKFLDTDFFTKLINVSLYQADFSVPFTTLKESDIIKFIREFLIDIGNELKVSTKLPSNINIKTYHSFIQLVKQILQAKEEVTSRLVNYDNVEKHFQNLDPSTVTLINQVKNERITDLTQFRDQLEEVLTIVESYNQLKLIKRSVLNLDQVKIDSYKTDVPVLNLIKNYKDAVLEAYNGLSNLKVLDKHEQATDYLIFNNKQSVETVIDHIKTFFSTKYSIFKTGYELLDTQLSGIESSTVTIITGPSNHAKSLFMLNLIRNMIIGNKDQLTEKDMFLVITLEDDINKLLRRILSVFGNNDAKIIKRLFVKASEIFKEKTESNINELENILSEVITQSIISVTNQTCSLVIKHCNENTFSVDDLRKLVDKHKMEGYNIKCIAIDYIDCMVSNSLKHSNYNDYDAQGQIVQDLRLTSRVYTVPVITITQNSKLAENFMQPMNNSLIGDSYKKVRFSDTIIMIRQREDLDLISDIVKKDVIKAENTSVISASISDVYYKDIIAFEVAITKAKEGSRSPSKFHLFSRTNLRIYDEFDKLKNDLTDIENNSINLLQKIEIAGFGNDISASLFEDNFIDEISLV